MPALLHHLLAETAAQHPEHQALVHRNGEASYRVLWEEVCSLALRLRELGLQPGDRVAVFLPKQLRTIYALFGISLAGCVLVPVNPVLKPRQVQYILDHCGARALITAGGRLSGLAPLLGDSSVRTVLLVDEPADDAPPGIDLHSWPALNPAPCPDCHRIDADVAAILYTSGSTGKPKGVVVSHRNLVAGAESVSSYLNNAASDRILSVLPLSFDAGFSQLTTGFRVGATVVLLDYLLPRDILLAVAQHAITGITAVPPIWNQLASLDWPPGTGDSLRYLANTGGALPPTTTAALAARLPTADIYLMYGLTEAFRSTYLPPDQVSTRPGSIGRAIPNAEIMVLNEQGQPCAPGEEGELVHRGALVTLGYWNDPEKTAERFRPAPGQDPALPLPEIAVWSGDRVYRDAQGYLFFVGRQDDQIKTSGYRVSPTELEEVAHDSGLVTEVAAIGVPDQLLGQAIVLVASPAAGSEADLPTRLLAHCRAELPAFMLPRHVFVRDSLPHNGNGKIDRPLLAEHYRGILGEAVGD